MATFNKINFTPTPGDFGSQSFGYCSLYGGGSVDVDSLFIVYLIIIVCVCVCVSLFW